MAGDGAGASTGDDGVTRWQHEGRVHRWQRPGSTWPGHTTFVALRGGEVVLGDRYASEGVERTYACEPRALLEGCFHAQVSEQLGARVLQELLAEVRRELGPRADATAEAEPTIARTEPARVAAEPARVAAKPAPVAAEPAPAVVAQPRAATVVSEHAEVVDLTLVACPSASLPLVVALRGITRAPVQELLGRLHRLPCTVLAGVSRAEAERAQALLQAHGAAVTLAAAGG